MILDLMDCGDVVLVEFVEVFVFLHEGERHIVSWNTIVF